MKKHTLLGLTCSAVIFSIFCVVPSIAQSCSVTDLSTTSNQIYTICKTLPTLTSYLYWNYDSSSGEVHVAFRKTKALTSNWIAWGINPDGQYMKGLQAIVAYKKSDGNMTVHTSPVQGYGTQLQKGNLSFPVSSLSAISVDEQMIIFATLNLNGSLLSTNHLWQEGGLSGDVPQPHAFDSAHLGSIGTINFNSGLTTTGSVPKLHKKNVHGVLNAVSWGTLMPIGVIFARYLKVFKAANPAWFYMHAGTQFSAYAIGVGGWATGLALGNKASGKIGTHRNFGITLFVFGTLQVFAMLLRPKPDHKYRFYWKVYHQVIGYATIGLSIWNVYRGLDILDPAENWKKAYTAILIFLGAVAIALEIVTWVIVRQRKTTEAIDKASNGHNPRTHATA